MPEPIRVYTFPTQAATVYENDDGVSVGFYDGTWSHSGYPILDTPEYLRVVEEMGYSSPRRYLLEHELAHLCLFPQGIVWDAAHKVPMSMDEPERAYEEHIVNHFQRWLNLGTPDEHHLLEGFLFRHVGIEGFFLDTARPWLRLGRMLK
jgi:hypothetical protein